MVMNRRIDRIFRRIKLQRHLKTVNVFGGGELYFTVYYRRHSSPDCGGASEAESR